MNVIRSTAVLAALAIVSACRTAPPGPLPPAPAQQQQAGATHAVIRTFFATDRNPIGSYGVERMFGKDRSHVVYGSCDVAIPRLHEVGALESPLIWKMEFREDPERHMMLLSAVLTTRDQFFLEAQARARNAKAGPRHNSNALIFVHGYNVTFADAARRTAQMAYDLRFDGDPVFFSWPSQGKMTAYTIDEQNIEWAQSDVKDFLDDFLTRSQVDNVYLIAHSMGNRALTRAVASLLAEKPALRGRLKEVILAAPDIDAEVFKRDIAPALAAAGRPVTLYASSDDKALEASQRVHRYPRAGESGAGLVVVPGIETIDATGVDTSFMAHSYFANARPVLEDLFSLIHDGKRAGERRWLEPRESQGGMYWAFRVNAGNPTAAERIH